MYSPVSLMTEWQAQKASGTVCSSDWCICALLLTHTHTLIDTHIGSYEIHVNCYHESSVNPAMAEEVVISARFHKVTFLNEKVALGENCALLGHYAASSGNSLPTLRDNLSLPYSGIKNVIIFVAEVALA